MCVRVNKMLHSQLQGLLQAFRANGGFAENMTAERLVARRTRARAASAPSCPKCGKPMLRRMQNKGQMQGREFWGCSDNPRCNGTRAIRSDQAQS